MRRRQFHSGNAFSNASFAPGMSHKTDLSIVNGHLSLAIDGMVQRGPSSSSTLNPQHSSLNFSRLRTLSSRAGQALIEFAIISFCFTLLFCGMLMLGFLLFSANVLQQAADVGAMEFARFPAPPNPESESENAAFFYEQLEASGLYHEADLIVSASQDPVRLPLINRLLFPLYLYDPDLDRYRYPGALATNSAGAQTVLIPIVGSRDPVSGVETIAEWRRVVEEVVPANSADPCTATGPYSMTSSSFGTLDRGFVALRINYPYQSAAMVAYTYQDTDGNPVTPTDALGRVDIVNHPVRARDDEVSNDAPLPCGYSLARTDYGFGSVSAFATQVRPYRKVISAQGIYRRELFSSSSLSP